MSGNAVQTTSWVISSVFQQASVRESGWDDALALKLTCTRICQAKQSEWVNICRKDTYWRFVVPCSLKEQLFSTQSAMDVREHMASILERQSSTLEETLLNMQLRITKLIQQWRSIFLVLFHLYLCLHLLHSHVREVCTLRMIVAFSGSYYVINIPTWVTVITLSGGGGVAWTCNSLQTWRFHDDFNKLS